MPQEMSSLRPTLDTGPAPAAAAPADRRRPNPQAAAYVRALRLEVAQWLPEALIATMSRLKEAGRQGPTPAARADADEAAEALHDNGRPWCRQLERALQDALSAELADTQRDGAAPEVLSPFSPVSDEAPLALTLTLMDEDRIDEEIAISRLVQIADVEADAVLRDLAALCSGMRGFSGISPEANPMRPMVVARALRQGVQAFGLRKPVRLLLLRELGGAVGKMLPKIYGEQLHLLQSWGVAPAQFAMRGDPQNVRAVILDGVGAAYLSENVRALRHRGTLVVIGLLAGANGELPLGELLQKRGTVRGSVLRSRPLDEKIARFQSDFPEESVSRSSLHRYGVSLSEQISRMREIETAARVVVEELGENADDRAGALLCQSITTLANHAALMAQARDNVSIDEIRKLARAAKDTIDARSKSLKERQTIEQAARDRLIAEQKAKLEQVVKSAGLSAETADTLRRQILGIQ